MTHLSRKGSIAEYEALRLLRRQGYFAARSYGDVSPPNLFAMREREVLLLMVRYSHAPLPDAEAVSRRFHEDIVRFQSFRNPSIVRKECWVLTPPDEWSYFEILPGGIRNTSHDWLRFSTNGGVPWKTTRRAEPLSGACSRSFHGVNGHG